MGLHQRLLDAGEGWYRRRRARMDVNGRPRHGRRIGWWSTKLPRLARPFFRDVVWRLPPSPGASQRIALTFDDGPTREHTTPILDCLERYQVRGTFFLVGSNCQSHPELVRDIADRGHVLGNHTWSHLDTWLNPFPRVADELRRTEDLMCEIAGMVPSLVRPPHGHYTAKLRTWCAEHGRTLVLWDTLPADFTSWATANSLAAFLDRQVRDRSIIVLHDSIDASATLALLDQWLPRMRDAGWTFETVISPVQT